MAAFKTNVKLYFSEEVHSYVDGNNNAYDTQYNELSVLVLVHILFDGLPNYRFYLLDLWRYNSLLLDDLSPNRNYSLGYS